MAGFDSPISTLLGGSPPSSLSLGKRAGDVRGMSLSSLCSALEDGEEESNSSSSDKESIRESPERESYSSSLLEIGIKTSTTSASTSTSSSTALLAARRARVLGANVATVDASLPPIVAGSGCRLFAEEEEEEAEAEASAASAGGADGESENPTLTKEKIEKKKKTKLVPFLDAQNNVAHLGHSHPAVAAALSTAFQTLNTNSRYLHPALVEHAEQLVELLSSSSPSSSSPSTSSSSSPPPPSRNGVEDPVVYYVPSGTEANDLALRIARAFHEEEEEAARSKKKEKASTSSPSPSSSSSSLSPSSPSPSPTHRHHYLALEGAYHGHAGEPARVSSYVSFGGKVGSPCPEDVSLLRLPDSVRDKSNNSSWDPAPAVRAAALRARRASSSPSSLSTPATLTAFIFESFPSCAGQVLLPEGWLSSAVAAARADAEEHGSAPPVVIADEVQTGLGRLGPLASNSLWAFQHFGVRNPDIVTIGKPAANGFPFGAVVASRRIAAAFAGNHPPFFSTFGGCTAAAVAALATLGALRIERLPERAAEVGAGLLVGLQKMVSSIENEKVRSELVIQVRGVGLMIGIEVAFSEEARGFAAAPAVASFVAAHCRNFSKVLISCDGAGERRKSVLKVKPPLCFGFEEAEELVEALRMAFEAVPGEMLKLEEEAVEEALAAG